MPQRTLRSTLILSSLAASFLLVAGCGGMGFLGQRYDNFTAYYNGFYNAERVYADGTEGISRTARPVDRSQFHSIFERQTGNTSSRDFESAVKKSADLLREHPDSKWVDDALLLIGKSYFYQENFVGAEQKFREVMQVSEDEAEEARFWLARTLITAGALPEARTVLTEGVASDRVRDRWKAMYELALGDLAVREGAMEEAASFLASGLQNVRDKEVGARAQFLYGQVLETLDRPEEAVRAYERVHKYRYPFELGYAARYSAARVLGMHVDADEGLERVRKMERDDKNVDSRGELRLLRGKILQHAGRFDSAYSIYDALLYEENPDQSVTQVRSRVHLAMAEFYREVDGDFVMAAAYYDSAATGLSARSGSRSGAAAGASSPLRRNSAILAPEAVGDINEIKSSFAAYASAYSTIAEMDSLLHLGSLPKEQFDARVLAMRQARARELAEMQRQQEADRRNSQFQQQQRSGQGDVFQNQGLPEGKIIPGVNDGAGSNASGFLYHQDPIRVQEGVATFRERWGDRPLVPNWRREDAIRSSSGGGSEANNAASEGLEAGGDLDSVLDEVTGENADPGLPQIDLSGIPRDSTSRAELRSRRALARYDVGNTLFLNMSMPDSAAAWYRLVVDEDPNQAVARRALYALAEVQRALGDEETADRLYREVLDRYPNSEFAVIVARNLGLQSQEVAADSARDARLEYEAVRKKQDADSSGVSYATYLKELLGVASRWKEQTVAAQSMMTAARAHLEWADADSARIVAPLPISPRDSTVLSLWPDRVVVAPDSSALAVVAPDSSALASAMPDSSALASAMPDSSALAVATPDSSALAVAAPDSSALAVAAPDSSALAVAAPDSSALAVAAPDSSALAVAAPDSSALAVAAPDSSALAVAAPDSLHLGDLYAWVKEHFAGTPYFSEADRMALVLDEFMAPPVNEEEAARQLSANDSLVMAMLRGEKPLSREDSTLADSTLADSMLADSTGGSSAVDPGLLPDSSEAVGEQVPLNESELRGEAVRDVPGIPAAGAMDSTQVVIREDMWPLVEGNETSAIGEGYWLVVGGDHPDESAARQNTSLLKRLLMGNASLVRVLGTTESDGDGFVTAIGPFQAHADAVLFYTERENILRDRIRVFQLVAP